MAYNRYRDNFINDTFRLEELSGENVGTGEVPHDQEWRNINDDEPFCQQDLSSPEAELNLEQCESELNLEKFESCINCILAILVECHILPGQSGQCPH